MGSRVALDGFGEGMEDVIWLALVVGSWIEVGTGCMPFCLRGIRCKVCVPTEVFGGFGGNGDKVGKAAGISGDIARVGGRDCQGRIDGSSASIVDRGHIGVNGGHGRVGVGLGIIV